MPRADTVAVVFSPTVWDTAAARALPFDHTIHAARACQDCHLPPAGRAGRTDCAACHAEHHRAEASCSTCHQPPAQAAHDLSAHVTCAGSGCHQAVDPVAPVRTVAVRAELSRTLCLLCHAPQADHEPGGSCHVCHRIPEPSRAGLNRR
jgi:hypothetical protein